MLTLTSTKTQNLKYLSHLMWEYSYSEKEDLPVDRAFGDVADADPFDDSLADVLDCSDRRQCHTAIQKQRYQNLFAVAGPPGRSCIYHGS